MCNGKIALNPKKYWIEGLFVVRTRGCAFFYLSHIFRAYVAIIIFQRILHVIDVFVDCLDGGFHTAGNDILFIL